MEYKLELPQWLSAALVYLGQVKMEISGFCLCLICYTSTCACPSVVLFLPLYNLSNSSIGAVYSWNSSGSRSVVCPLCLELLLLLKNTPQKRVMTYVRLQDNAGWRLELYCSV